MVEKEFRRQIKAVRLSAPFLEMFFLGKEVHYKVENPLPHDAKTIQIGYDINTNTVVAFVESSEFPMVGEFGTPENYHFTVTDLTEKEELKK